MTAPTRHETLPAIVDRAAAALANARTSAEVLEAHELAGFAYDAAKRTGRLLRAKGAHDDLVAAALRAQGDALLLEAGAKLRLADEYDAARDRGEVAPHGRFHRPDIDSGEVIATLADLGLTADTIYRARQIRDAEAAQPGFVRGIVEARLRDGLEPNQKALRTGVRELLSFNSEAELDQHVKSRRAEKQAEKKDRRDARIVTLTRATHAASQRLGFRLYNVIYADPPWRYEAYSAETGMDRAADNHYPTMTTADIAALPVPAAPCCGLFLWATVPMIFEAGDVLRALGFAYSSHYVWNKNRIGLGYRVRNKHEILLIGTRGGFPLPPPELVRASVIDAPLGRHSEKPAVFAEIIESQYPDLAKVELFARMPRPGWDVWGNEVEPSLQAAE